MKYILRAFLTVLLLIVVAYGWDIVDQQKSADRVELERPGDKGVKWNNGPMGYGQGLSQSRGWSAAGGNAAKGDNGKSEKYSAANSGQQRTNPDDASFALNGDGKIILPQGVSEDDIPASSKTDLAGLEKRLEDIIENRVAPAEREGVAPVLFSTVLPAAGDSQTHQQSEFDPRQNRIYSIIETGKIDFTNKNKVLIKWYDGMNDVIMFKYVNIAPAENINYVWQERVEWRPGSYTVDFYELDNNVRLLATGSYTVTDEAEYIGSLGVYDVPQAPYTVELFKPGDDIWIRFNYSAYVDMSVRLFVYEVVLKTVLLDEVFLLPTAYHWQKELLLGDYVAEIKPGTYYVEVIDTSGNLRGRTLFHLSSR